MILREVSNRSFVSPGDLALVDERPVITASLAQFGVGRRRRIRQQGIQQRGLPCAVAAHQSDFFAADNAGGEVLNDLLLAVGFAQMLNFQNVLARGTLLLEFDERPLNIRPR